MPTARFCLVSEAHRIRIAHLFDSVPAAHKSLVDPLPHRITTMCTARFRRHPLRFLPAADPRADADGPGLLVKLAAAREQLEREKARTGAETGTGTGSDTGTGSGTGAGTGTGAKPRPKRYHRAVALDATRARRNASRAPDEAITHLAAHMGANVRARWRSRNTWP